MTSIAQFSKLLKTLPPKKRVLNVLLVGGGLLIVAFMHYVSLLAYTPPDTQRLIAIEGRVNGDAYAWKHNRLLVRFGVSYVLQGEKQVGPAYAFASVYRQLGLRVGSKVRLVVEVGDKESVLRKLETQDGITLFDDDLNKKIVAWQNESVWMDVVLVMFAAIGFIFVALIMIWRHRRVLLGRS
ncbi:hypothetical protein [Pseudomonas guariconensis]|uniref:hypothetical protein n=1 Tax=Pseudomonas guariconensis TaxID=1288410 RepID=UPI0018AA81C7|nr:hypothetical protein [Pseudomonas guariconensis]MBF8742542.1 hypothetical protein [Pseudomonas guariconensis]MBF8751726.1 hypothetical protein [Pseudomonas guariconensis]